MLFYEHKLGLQNALLKKKKTIKCTKGVYFNNSNTLNSKQKKKKKKKKNSNTRKIYNVTETTFFYNTFYNYWNNGLMGAEKKFLYILLIVKLFQQF